MRGLMGEGREDGVDDRGGSVGLSITDWFGLVYGWTSVLGY